MISLRNQFCSSLVALAIAACAVSNASAQGVGFQKGKTYVGPTVGFGIGGGLGFGASGDYGITDNISMGLDLGYTQFTEDFGGLGISTGGIELQYTLFAALVAGSYHFTPGEAFDPFIKLGVGYFNWDAAYLVNGKEENGVFAAAYASGVGFTGQIGARYEVSPLVNLRATVGYPFYLAGGVDFTFGGVGSRATKSGAEQAEADRKSEDRYRLYVGPYIHAKPSINTTVAEGYKTGVVFNSIPDFGISTMIPFGKGSNIGFTLDLGHSSLGYQIKPENSLAQSDSTNYTESYTYFNVSPGFNFGGFTLGVNIGMPLSASMESERGDVYHPLANFPHVKGVEVDYTDSLATLVEVRLGGSIPLINEPSGKLLFNIQASYALTGLYNNYKSYEYAYDVTKDDNGITVKTPSEDLNPKPAAISLGLSYQFGIGL